MNEKYPIHPASGDLFDRVVSILEQARANVVRAVNNSMVIAYWLIGREIVQEIQGGEGRAEYGKQIIEQLSSQLKGKYGRGFSVTKLCYFRTFYTIYSDRKPEIRHFQSGVLDDMSLAVRKEDGTWGFSPNLGWSHYQVLMVCLIRMHCMSPRSKAQLSATCNHFSLNWARALPS